MRIRSHLVWTFITITLGVASANLYATISSGSKPMEDRFSDAGLVCLCVPVKTVQVNPKLKANGKLAAADFEVAVRIVRLYKGASRESEIVIRYSDRDPMMGTPLQEGATYILFLRLLQRNLYESSDAALPAPGLSPPGQMAGSGGGQAQLEDEIRNAISNAPDIASTRESLKLLLEFRTISPQTITRLDRIAQGNPSDVVLLSLEVLCRCVRDPEKYLSKLITSLLEIEKVNPASTMGLEDNLSGIGDLLASSSTTRDIGGLEKLANSRIPGLGLCALLGIRRLKDPATIPFLIGELDSTNPQIQYEAVITLAEITGKDKNYSPGMGIFLMNRQKYTTLWKSWYNSR